MAGITSTGTASTWKWIGGSGSPEIASNWTLVAGPGNASERPQAGDSAINVGGTITLGSDPQLTGNAIYAGGTLGTPAVLVMTGDSGTNVDAPTLDQNSAITSAVPGAVAAETTVLDAYGYFVNDGTIAADGPAGSSFTIAIAGTTVNGTAEPGAFINYGELMVDAGNSMTITVAGTSGLYNTSEILVNGGSLLLTAASNALGGGYAPGTGVVVIDGGGTAEINVGYSSTVSGIIPVYAFADSTAGDTLKIDNIGSFGGQILGFGVGDTIDLGTSLAVSQIVLSGSSGILALENSGGTILASLQLASGNFGVSATTTETIAVSGTSAGVFNVITGTDGDTLLTTSVAIDDSASTSGTWQSASVWAGGTVPGSLDTALLGMGASSPFTVTTGSSSVSVGQLSVVSDNAALQITSNTTVSLYPIQQFAGSVEVQSGDTLSAPDVQMSGGTLAIDPGAVLALSGVPSNGVSPNYNAVAAHNGTISVSNTGSAAMEIGSGSLLINGGTLNAGIGQASGDGGRINIGYEGSGTPAVVTVQNSGTSAGVVTDTYAILSSDPTSFGILTLNGNVSWTDEIDPHDTLSTRGYMNVGYDSPASNNTGTLTPAFSGTATLVVENGATLTDQSYAEIGVSIDSAGSAIVSNGIWKVGASVGGFLDVGLAGSGALLVNNAGTVAIGSGGTFLLSGNTFTGSGLNLGGSVSAVGTVVVSGAGALLTDKAGMNVGQAGTGDLQVLNGGSIQLTGTNGINIGTSSGAIGTLLVSGTDSTSGAPAELILGSTAKGISAGAAGNGVLDVESGGSIVMNGTGGISVAQSLNATGLVIVNGPSAVINEGTAGNGIGIGQASGANGTVYVENGGSIILNGLGTAAGVGVGQSLSATGTIIISGGGALLADNAVNGGLTLGGAGHGVVAVESGGSLTVAGNGVGIASTSTGTGTLDVFGGAVTLTGTAGGLSVGQNGSGTLAIANGGEITINGTATGFNVGLGSGSSGSVSINSGTLTTAGYFSVGNTNAAGTVTIGGGGMLVNQNTLYSPVISAAGTGHAAVEVNGGTWLLADGLVIGNGSTVSGTGSLDISSGGLVSASASGFIDIGQSSGGNGTLAVENNGTLLGGGMSIANAFTGTASGYMDIGAGGTVEIGQLYEGGGGTVVVGGGGSSALLAVNGGALSVGGQNTETATLTVNTGGTVSQTGSFTMSVGGGVGNNGTVAVNGGTVLATSLGVGGYGATGLLTVDQNGVAVISGGTTAYDSVGSGTGGSGTLIVTQSGTLLVTSGGFQIGGGSASASLLVTDNGRLTTTDTSTFGFAGNIGATGTGVASGAVNSNGTWSVYGQLGVGESNTGSLDISTGGLVNAGTNMVQIGAGTGSNGTITVEQGGTLEGGALSIANAFESGNAAGVLSVGPGGTVILNGGTQGSSIGSGFAAGGSGNGVLLINQGVVTETGAGFSVGGSNVSGTLTLENGGSLTTNAVNNGTFYGFAGDISASGSGIAVANVSNGGTWNANGLLIVGDSGAGSLTIGAGGAVTASSLDLGGASGGTVTVQAGGSLSAGQLTVVNSVGVGATGLLAINGGAMASATGIQVNGGGTIAIGGTSGAAVLSSSGFVTVGQSGIGAVLTINQGGTLAIAQTTDMAIGFNTGASGAVVVNGGLLQSNGVSFGGGFGTLAVQNGGVFDTTGNSISVGGGIGATSTLVVQNGTILDNGDYFGVGSFGGNGSVTVGSGGSIISQGSLEFVDINALNGGSAVATVSGGTWISDGSLIVGDTGSGSLDINSDGLVNVGTNTVIIGNQSNSSGIISLESGGVLQAGALLVDGDDYDLDSFGGADFTTSSTTYIASPGAGLLSVGNNATVAVSGSILVGSSGMLVMQGGTLGSTGLTVGSASFAPGGAGPVREGGFGLISAARNIVNDETLFASGGTLTLDTPLVTAGTLGGGVLEVDTGADLVVNGVVDSTQSVDFAGPGTLTVGDISQFLPADINGFGTGDTIVVTGVTSLSESFNPSTDQLVLTDSIGHDYTLQFTGSLSAASFTNAIFPPPPAAQAASWARDIAGDFDNPSEWSTGSVPTASTNATINFADDPQVVHDTGTDAVASLTNTAGDFVMAGGILTAGTLTNASQMSWTGGTLVLNPGTAATATLANTGTLTIAPNGQRLTATGTATITNAGTILVTSAPGTANLDAPLANTGTIIVAQGTLSLNGGGSSNGTGFAAGPNATLQFGAPASGAGGDFVITGGEYAIDNTTISGGTLDVSAASSVYFITALQLAAAGTLQLGAQNAAAQGSFLQGPSAWAGASGTPVLSGSGTLTVFGGGTLLDGVETGTGTTALIGTSLIGGSIAIDGGRTVENEDGWLNWSSGNIALGTGDAGAATQAGTLANAAGAIFYVTADGRIGNQGSASSVFANAGVTAVLAGLGETDIDAVVQNTGYIQAQTGTLSFNGGGSSDGGHLYVAPQAVLQFGTQASGASGGTFQITGGQYTAGSTVLNGGSLDVSAASGAVFVNSLTLRSGALLLGAQANAQLQGELLQAGGLLSGTGLLPVFGGASLTGGVQSGSGLTRLYGTSVLGGSFALDGGRTVENDGWLNWTSGTITLGGGDAAALTHSGTLSNIPNAIIYVTADGRIAVPAGASGTVANAGVIAVFAGAGETDIDAAIANPGFIQAQTGTLSLNGGGTSDAGHLYAAAGAVLQFGTTALGTGGDFVLTGGPYIVNHTVVNGSTLDLSAVSGVSFGASLTLASGSLLLGGAYPAASVLVQSGGTLSGTGILTVTQTAVLSGGLETGSGRTDLAAGGAIAGAVSFDGGRSVQNDGTLIWSGGSITLGGGDPNAASHVAILFNTGAALWDIATAGTVNSAGFGGTGIISNGGTIEKTGTGTAALYAQMFNDGTVTAVSGTLALEDGASGTGSFLVGDATLDFGAAVSGAETMQFLYPAGTLAVETTGAFGAVIGGFGAGAEIDARAIGFAAGTTTLGFSGGTLTVSDGAQSAAFTLTGTYVAGSFHLAADGQGGTAVTYG